MLYQRVETRSRHTITFSVTSSKKQDFNKPCLPITPITNDEMSILCKNRDFHLLEQIEHQHPGTYKVYHLPESELTDEPIHYTYRFMNYEKHLEIIGVILQNDIPKKILRLYNKYYFEKPKQLANNTWGCLLLASFQHNHHITQPTTLFVLNNTIRKKLNEITANNVAPNNCFCPEWEIIHLAGK
jgi:hypothetical protein